MLPFSAQVISQLSIGSYQYWYLSVSALIIIITYQYWQLGLAHNPMPALVDRTVLLLQKCQHGPPAISRERRGSRPACSRKCYPHRLPVALASLNPLFLS